VGVYIASAMVRRRFSWVLFLALLPSLSFFGHWPEQFAIPGTAYAIAIPGAAGGAEAHDHASHCHAEAASCSDAPAAAGVSFALMNESLTLLVAGGVLVLLALRWWVPGEDHPLSPEPAPPRFLSAYA